MATLQKIIGSPLMLRLGVLAAQMIREVYPSHKAAPARELSRAEDFTKRCLFATGEVVAVCEQMEVAVELLAGYRRITLTSGSIFTRYDYLLYQLENHLLRSVMLTDRILQLVNVVFSLGLPESECRFATIMKNGHVTATDVPRVYAEIDKILQPARRDRNVVVHRRGLRDDQLEDVSAFYVLQKSGSGPVDAEEYFVLFKRKTDQFVREKKVELASLNGALYAQVAQLFEIVLPAFEDRLAEQLWPAPNPALPRTLQWSDQD